jgi:prevent-host-death family protein
MFSVKGDATIATITDLRRSASDLLGRAEAGESVVVQRNAEPVGVLLNYARYQQMLEAEEKLENLELLLLALQREADIVSGKTRLVPLEEVLAEFGLSPEPRPVVDDGGEEL